MVAGSGEDDDGHVRVLVEGLESNREFSEEITR